MARKNKHMINDGEPNRQTQKKAIATHEGERETDTQTHSMKNSDTQTGQTTRKSTWTARRDVFSAHPHGLCPLLVVIPLEQSLYKRT